MTSNKPQQSLSSELDHIIKEIKELSNQTIYENFQSSLSQYPFLVGSASGKEKLILFSSDYRFYREFKKNWSSSIFYVELTPQKNPQMDQWFHRYPQLLGVFYVTGKGTARILNQLKTPIKAKLLVVNSTHPGVIKDPHLFRAVININAKNYFSGSWLSKTLKKSEITSAHQ